MGNILVGLIVAVAFFYMIRRMIKAFKGQPSCGCGGCGGCAVGPENECCGQTEDSGAEETGHKHKVIGSD
ncbi:FeoB-associated Cys-rich membrane protein [uncultured Desulfobacter sp.]|uniref:FeoB-associated Cys-rich membrane protein n=1 Tax=uncultured Desulfobacter sp. TaxID=240139 RepID=UPI0029F4B7FA|nr:FeoB-associated Cys-rich membrane protein [uncultured Desulfobacter sp.]